MTEPELFDLMPHRTFRGNVTLRTPSFLRPFKIIPQIWALFGIFLGIGVVVAQLGILLSFCSAYHSRVGLVDVLNINLSAGNFYTFSISLIAAAFVPFLIEYLSKDDIKFKHYKILTSIVMAVALMIPMIYFFSSIVSDMTAEVCSRQTHVVDPLQLIFYVASMIMCTYAFCVSYLHLDYDSYADLDNAELIRLGKSIPRGHAKNSRDIDI